jgi:hypothetical protein
VEGPCPFWRRKWHNARYYAILRRLSVFTTGIGFGKRNTRSGMVLICDDGKDRCIGADPQRQNCERREGEATILAEDAKSMDYWPEHVSHPDY